MKFKLGIYQLRQIIRIERGGIIISCADSRYQPSMGIRYELSPDEWFVYSYRFFPMYLNKDSYDEEFLMRERYYDYYAKRASAGQCHSDGGHTYIFAIFKNGHNTGYIIKEDTHSSSYVNYWHGRQRGSRYSSIFINGFRTGSYKKEWDDGRDGPMLFANSTVWTAICVLADGWGFKKDAIDINSLNNNCDENPGSCILHSKLTNLLKDCRYPEHFIRK